MRGRRGKRAWRADPTGYKNCHTGHDHADDFRHHGIPAAIAGAAAVLSAAGASAEEEAILDALDLGGLNELCAGLGLNADSLLKAALENDWSAAARWFPELLGDTVHLLLKSVWDVCAALAVPAFAMLVIRLLFGKKALALGSVILLCRACVVSALTGAFAELLTTADRLLSALLRCSEALQPVLTTVVALCGAEGAAANISPLSSLCAVLIQRFLCAAGLPLAASAAAVAIAGNLSENIRLKRLQELLKQVHAWLSGLLVAAFLGILTIQERLSFGYSGTGARTARYALENIIPVIGGNVAESMDTLLSAASAVKNAVGVLGLILLCAVCSAPLIRLWGMTLALRFASAVMEPLGDDGVAAMTSQFSDAVEMLAVTALSALLLCGILTGSCLWITGGILR